MGSVLLIRHGEVSPQAEDYEHLSETGFAQAARLGAWLSERIVPTGAVAGRMNRHRQTAEACLAAMPEERRRCSELRLDDAFNEFDRAEIFAHGHGRPAVERWISGRYPGDYRESWLSFRSRCLEGLHRLPTDTDSLVFTSAGAITAIAQELLGISEAKSCELMATLLNGGVSWLDHQTSGWRLRTLNFRP